MSGYTTNERIMMIDRLSRELIDRITVKEFNITLMNGWSNYGGENEVAKARIKDGIMTVTGQLSSGTIVKNTQFFMLPSGYIVPYNSYGTLRRFSNPATLHLVRFYPGGASGYVDNNFDLPAAGMYYLHAMVPVKYVGGGALLNRLFAPLMRVDRGCVA